MRKLTRTSGAYLTARQALNRQSLGYKPWWTAHVNQLNRRPTYRSHMQQLRNDRRVQ